MERRSKDGKRIDWCLMVIEELTFRENVGFLQLKVVAHAILLTPRLHWPYFLGNHAMVSPPSESELLGVLAKS